MRTHQSYPDIHGVVPSFIVTGDETLARICDTLSLSMQPHVLGGIREHYLGFERRIPCADEIIMLDILYSSAEEKRHFYISELGTNDPDIARTFEDIKEKYYAVFGGDGRPLSLDKLFETAEKYLAGCGIGGKALCEARVGLPLDLCGSYVRDEETGESLSFFAPRKDLGKADALYIGVDSCAGTDDFLIRAAKNSAVLKIIPAKKSFFAAVLDDCEHAELFISEDPRDLRLLPSYGAGGYIIKCGKNEAGALEALAADLSVPFSVIAAERKSGRLRFRSARTAFTIDGDFLRALGVRNTSLVRVCAPKRSDKAPIIRRTAGNGVTLFSTGDISFDAGEAVLLRAAADAVASCTLRSVRDAFLSCRISLPVSVSCDDALSLVLGLYRAETELCIRTQCDAFTVSDAMGEPKISVAVLGGSEPLPSESGERGFVISAAKNDDHTADGRSEYYANIRRLFDYILKFKNSGHVKSLRALCGDSFYVCCDCVPSEASGIRISPSEGAEQPTRTDDI